METSPVLSQKEEMDFAQSLDAILGGKKVRRLEWPDDGTHIVMADDKIMIFKPEDDMLHPLILSRGDMVNADWVMVNGQN